MEASGAGLAAASGDGQAAAGDGSQGEQQQQPADGGQQQQQPQGDAAIQELVAQVSGMADSQEAMREFLTQQADQLQSQQQQQEATDAGIDLSFLQHETDPAVAGQRLQEAIDARADARAQELLAPVQDQLREMRDTQEAGALEAEFPQLADPAVAKATMEATENYAKIVGKPELAHSIPFARLVYMAGRASELAGAQNGASGAPAATLEGAGGASPAGQQGDTSAADAIAEKWAQRRSVLPTV